MPFSVYLILNGIIGLGIFLLYYYVVIPVWKDDKFAGVLIGLFSLLPILFSVLIHAEGIKETQRIKIDPRKYEVVKTDRNVAFITDESTIQTDRAFIYNNAQDTSVVSLYKVKEINYFNDVHQTYLEIQVIDRDTTNASNR